MESNTQNNKTTRKVVDMIDKIIANQKIRESNDEPMTITLAQLFSL
jgi:hypothetical protein